MSYLPAPSPRRVICGTRAPQLMRWIRVFRGGRPQASENEPARQTLWSRSVVDKVRSVAVVCPPRPVRIVLTAALDASAPKDARTITFICKRRFGYSGNIRAVCEAFAASGKYRVQLWCEAPLSAATKRSLVEQGIRLLTWFSPLGLWRLVSSGVVVVDHSIRDAYIVRPCSHRTIVNLWHGVPIKNIELGMQQLDSSRKRVIENTAMLYDALIANSPEDRRAMARAFGVDEAVVHATGLPRLDMLTGHHPLASDLAEDRKRLLAKLCGRKLVLYAPTFREHAPSPLAQLTAEDWSALNTVVRACGAVLGLRAHPYDTTPHPYGFDSIISVRAAEYPETNLVLRDTAVLITDFSSVWVDYILLKRPVLGFAMDRWEYAARERGFIYDFNDVFPGPFSGSVDELARNLKNALAPDRVTPDYSRQTARFHMPNGIRHNTHFSRQLICLIINYCVIMSNNRS